MISNGKNSEISPELEELLNSCTNLPSLPAVALRIIEASKDPDITLHDVSEIICSDPAISTKLLKVANSSLYSQRRYIKSITDRVEEIEKSSRIDHLTKVYNRQHIDRLLEDEYKESNINRWPLSLAFIDIDDFKLINDTYGHLVGDELLKLISDFFLRNLRDTDSLARYGGDEFLLMLPGSTADISKSVLDRLLKIYLEQVVLETKGLKISASVSIGLATHMDMHKFDSLKEFMAAADEALYKAKSQGKNCISVY